MKVEKVNGSVALEGKSNVISKRQRAWEKFKSQKQLQVMAILGAIWMFIFCYIPMYGIVIAFKDFNIIKPISESPWVGFKHFIDFLSDERLGLVLQNTIGISLLKLLICFPLPILFALLLNEIGSTKYKKFIQTVSYLPHFLSWVILGGIMITWLSDTGIVNNILMTFGLIKEPISFMAEPSYFWGIAVTSDLWKELGWSAIIYLAAIAGVDPELYEVARIDGAGRFRRMWEITLPCIKGTIAVLFILAVAGLLNTNFDQVLVLGNVANREASEVLDMYVYNKGITGARYSYATAVGLVKSVISFVLLWMANTFSKKMTGSGIY